MITSTKSFALSLFAALTLLSPLAGAEGGACLKDAAFMKKFDYDGNGLIQSGDQKKFADDFKRAVTAKKNKSGLDTNGDGKPDFFKDLNNDGKVNVVDVVRYQRLNVNGDATVDVRDMTMFVAKTKGALDCSQIGDVNLDSKVNKNDVDALTALVTRKRQPNMAKPKRSDLNKDGKVNVQDVVKLTSLLNSK